MLPSDRTQFEPIPIWMAALVASGCEVKSSCGARAVDWRFASGRAVYTNHSAETEIMQPFGIAVRAGETMVVSWRPGETAFTVELARAAA